METWTGAQARTPLPSQTNRYLFSGVGAVDSLQLYTTSRSWIVLLAAGTALVFGLLLIYVPGIRHPATLLVVAVLLFGAGLLYPEPTLLMLQAASLGLALTLVAALLGRTVTRRRRRTPSVEAFNSGLEKGSTQVQYQRAVAGNLDPTQTAAPPVPPSTPDHDS